VFGISARRTSSTPELANTLKVLDAHTRRQPEVRRRFAPTIADCTLLAGLEFAEFRAGARSIRRSRT